MPRYYRRRYPRVVAPKKKWASNIISWTGNPLDTLFLNIVANKDQSQAPTPTVIKTGNFKLSVDLSILSTAGTANPVCTFYIIYVPEGWPQTYASYIDLVKKHPEWIMACKVAGGSVTTSADGLYSVDTVNMSSRLKRNLNSGDTIALLIQSSLGAEATGTITGVCRWWTCAN